jgi:hypothetical protein
MAELLSILSGRDSSFLDTVASYWGIEDFDSNPHTLNQEIVSRVSAPENAQAVLSSLPELAREALQKISEHGGRVVWFDFSREYGEIREMGPARRDRVKPHLDSNVTPAEMLYYRALIGRAFFDSRDGPQEYAFIPDELLMGFQFEDSIQPEHLPQTVPNIRTGRILRAGTKIVDDTCTLLAGLRNGFSKEVISPHLLLNPDSPQIVQGLELQFLKTLLVSAGLVDKQGVPIPTSVKEFFVSSRSENLLYLFQNWLVSDVVEELHITSGLVLRGELDYDALASRQKMIGIIQKTLSAHQNRSDLSDGFIDLEAFIKSVKERQPHFLRTAGQYDAWHIESAKTGELLAGFDSWENVEGRLLRFLVCGILFWLGALDLMIEDSVSNMGLVVGFRISDSGTALLGKHVPTISERTAKMISVRQDGVIEIPRFASREMRYQVSRFCEWQGLVKQGFRYRIDPHALERARAQSLRVDHFQSLLRKYARTVPPNITRALHRWSEFGSQVKVESCVLLFASDADVLNEIRASRCGRFLGKPLSSTAILVQPGAFEKLSRSLAEEGYLGEFTITGTGHPNSV